MAVAIDQGVAIRPRTTGEILDDAIRLYLGDAMTLMGFSFIFLTPAAISLLVMMCEPRPQSLWLKPLWPLTTAALFALTGLSSAVCQEIYQRRSQGEPITLTACLRALATMGLGHVGLRAVLLTPFGFAAGVTVSVAAFAVRGSDSSGSLPVIAGGLALVLMRIVLGPPLAGAHPALSSQAKSAFAALGASLLDGLRQPGKAMVLVLVQIVLFLMAMLNLQLVLQFGLEMVSSLIGLETAFVGHVLSVGNPVYVLALLLLVWIVMTPLTEAVQYLFHADGRARHEGLDLWFRVGRSFPISGKSLTRAGAVVVALLLLASGSRATDVSPQSVGKVRQEIHQLREQQPYPGGKAVETRLAELARELDAEGSASRGDFRWFYRDLDAFRSLSESAAHEKLAEMEQNLALVERNLSRSQDHKNRVTREDLKSLLPPSEDADAPTAPPPQEASGEHKPVKNDTEAKTLDGRRGARGPTIVGPAGWGGLGSLIWMMLGGLAVLAAATGVVLLWRRRPAFKREPAPAPTARLQRNPVAELAHMDPQTLWREADRLAREGNRLEALRHLYAALLGLLHRGGLIKLEAARTNGEYVRQLQRSSPPPSPLADDFAHLTGTFEWKWYGEKACQPHEYDDCRGKAEQIRDAAT